MAYYPEQILKRDYIYIPLGGSYHGSFYTCTNIMIPFLIRGIWHGTSWMFLIWGALQGFALVTIDFGNI